MKRVRSFERLVSASEVIISVEKGKCLEIQSYGGSGRGRDIYSWMSWWTGKIDRLKKEKQNLEKEVQRVNNKLNNPGFISKAPAHIIEKEKEKGKKYEDMLAKVVEQLKNYMS